MRSVMDLAPAYARVEHQVQQHLAQAGGVGQHAGPGVAAGPLDPDRDLGAQGRVHQVADVLGHLEEVDGCGTEVVVATERHEAAGQRRSLLAAAGDGLEALPHGAVDVVARQQQIGMASHHEERVGEVVGHPAGEEPDGAQLLALVDPLLEGVRRRDVDHRAEEPDRPSGGVRHGLHVLFEGPDLAVAHDAVRQPVGAGLVQQPLDHVVHDGPVVGVDGGPEAVERLVLDAEDLVHLGRPVDGARTQVDLPDAEVPPPLDARQRAARHGELCLRLDLRGGVLHDDRGPDVGRQHRAAQVDRRPVLLDAPLDHDRSPVEPPTARLGDDGLHLPERSVAVQPRPLEVGAEAVPGERVRPHDAQVARCCCVPHRLQGDERQREQLQHLGQRVLRCPLVPPWCPCPGPEGSDLGERYSRCERFRRYVRSVRVAPASTLGWGQPSEASSVEMLMRARDSQRSRPVIVRKMRGRSRNDRSTARRPVRHASSSTCAYSARTAVA